MTSEIYTLSLHDALPISAVLRDEAPLALGGDRRVGEVAARDDGQLKVVVHHEVVLAHLLEVRDRKSTRLNSSHRCISYAVFCLKKKTKTINKTNNRKPTT